MRHTRTALLVLAALVLANSGLATAQEASTATMRPPISYEVLTVTAAAKGLTEAKIAPSALAANGPASMAFISNEGGPLRLCLDGTTASATACHLVPDGSFPTVYTTRALRQVSMYRGSAADVTVHVTYFRQIGQ